MKLVIVETSAQAKILSAILGDGWHVEPCYGDVRHLRAGNQSITNGFEPDFNVAKGKGGLIVRLKKLLRQADVIYAATPPGRSGDMTAWHVLALVPDAAEKPVCRVDLTSLGSDTVRAAFMDPHPLDMRQIDAELARRMINHLIGTAISEALSSAHEKIALSYTGMLALRLLLEREQDIAAHIPQHWWKPSAQLCVNDIPFAAQILNAKGTQLALRTEAQAAQLERMLNPANYWAESLLRGVKTHPAPTRLTLVTLIEAADREFNLSPERVLSVLATLYDAGWITHPNTTPKPESRDAALAYIQQYYGSTFADPNAVQAIGIAPVDISHVPDDTLGDGAILYSLIWRYFVAAHMKPAQEHISAARIRVGPARSKPYPVELRATSKQLSFDGWMRLFNNRTPNADDSWTPHLKEKVGLELVRIETQQMTSAAPQHYTESSLTLAIAELGVPLSEAAATIESLKSGGYVTVDDGGLMLADQALTTAAYIAENFDELTDTTFAAELAADIERIAAGEITRAELVTSFWSRFGESLTSADKPLTTVEGA